MPQNVAQKLLAAHVVSGTLSPGAEVGLRIEQTLTQDATGTLVMLELERLGVSQVRTRLSAQYVDHNLLQTDFKNADDHLFLLSACRRYGVWFSRPGQGVSHPVHMESFGVPGASLLGSDSHTCAAGAIGMLAIGAGGLEVALAMAGEPFFVPTPAIWGVKLTGRLTPWVSAKDVILELLRRHGVSGGLHRILEYHGPGVEELDAWDRHVIANMGAELGATTSVFPSDTRTREFLANVGREDAWKELHADPDARYDFEDEIALDQLEPLIAKPSSPGNVVPVREVLGEAIHQAYLGSSANPGLRDIAIAARMVEGKRIPEHVSFDINPATRATLLELTRSGMLATLLEAGARLHQTGCNGCIGMGQAPGTARNSLRTVPRNFPGRSGSDDDRVWLCSPETATASALRGVITDPRSFGQPACAVPRYAPKVARQVRHLLLAPDSSAVARRVSLVKGPNIQSLPRFDALPDTLELSILLKVGDDISTDEILSAGANVLPFRSNIQRIAQFCFLAIDKTYAARAEQAGPHAIVGGKNYGQGSSREHAALAPRSLGLRVVIARSFARIHRQNLVNFGVLPLRFEDEQDYAQLQAGDVLRFSNLRAALRAKQPLRAKVAERELRLVHDLSERQIGCIEQGGALRALADRGEP
ncbi:MAG TPA: aconitate hydratase [Polyangiales bacterium]|nr:aconitate hydratase [Polyangiales bacterium]